MDVIQWIRYMVLVMVMLSATATALTDATIVTKAGSASDEVFCVAKSDADPAQLQSALDWTCGKGTTMGSVDCAPIQSGGPCFSPDTLVNHASYAFTLYYLSNNAAPSACDFHGLATLSHTDPSSGTCVFPTSRSSTSSISSNVGSITAASTPPAATDGTTSATFFNSSPAPSPDASPASSVQRYLLFYMSCTLFLVFVL